MGLRIPSPVELVGNLTIGDPGNLTGIHTGGGGSGGESLVQARAHAFGTGLLMGAIHAVTGPDHMSALITIAVNQRAAAVWLGVRWGVGHSTGLILVTGLVVILRDAYGLDQDEVLDLFTSGMDWVVGLLMLGLGLWGYRTAWLLRRKMRAALPPEHESDEAPDDSLPRSAPLQVETHTSAPDLVIVRTEPSSFAMRRRGPLRPLGAVCRCARGRERSSRTTTSLIALGVGILHGIGGPGGVLAVLPTLLMPGPLASVLYLGAFCFAATAVMGGVAGVYGACTYRSREVSPSLPWVLSAISASTSVLIGIVWLVCSATGTLKEVLMALGLE